MEQEILLQDLKNLLENFFNNFELLKKNYKDYLVHINIFKWDILEK